MQGCAEQAVEQHVAGGAVEVIGVVHPLFELDVDVHPELACAGRGEAHEVRLHRPGDEHGIGVVCLRFAEVELELADLVPAHGKPGAIVALDPELDAERRSEIRRAVERSRDMAEPGPWELVDTGERPGHGASDGAKKRGGAMIPNTTGFLVRAPGVRTCARPCFDLGGYSRRSRTAFRSRWLGNAAGSRARRWLSRRFANRRPQRL